MLFVPRIRLIPSEYRFELKRLQFLVKLCFAVIISEAQGQPVKKWASI
jgi:hypothetical protein